MDNTDLDNFIAQSYRMALYKDTNFEWVSNGEAEDMMDYLISSSCGGENHCDSADKLRKGQMTYSVEYLAKNLPAVQYVTQFYLEMIIHGGLVTDNKMSQEMLDKWLKRKNVLGQTNGNVIRQALLSSVTYGYSGLRRVGEDLVYIAPNNFRIWKLPALMNNQIIPGIWTPEFYEIFASKKKRLQKEDAATSSKGIKEFLKDQNLHKGVDGSYYLGDKPKDATDIYVPKDLFCHLRHSDEGDYGISPLSQDRLQTTLIVDYMRNLDDEINNDGTDYMMFLQRRSSVGNSLGELMSQSAANATINAAIDSKQKANAEDSQMAAARALGKKMKRSAKTRINLINQNVVSDVKKMPGTVELNQYLSILNNAKGAVADIYGIAPMLAGSSGGGWSTGMASLIKFTLEVTIKPFQQRYAEQLSPMIKECVHIKPDVKFKEIDWGDIRERQEIEKIAADTKKAIEQANLYKAQAAAAKVRNSDTQTSAEATSAEQK